jgi:hypothetical protein
MAQTIVRVPLPSHSSCPPHLLIAYSSYASQKEAIAGGLDTGTLPLPEFATSDLVGSHLCYSHFDLHVVKDVTESITDPKKRQLDHYTSQATEKDALTTYFGAKQSVRLSLSYL